MFCICNSLVMSNIYCEISLILNCFLLNNIIVTVSELKIDIDRTYRGIETPFGERKHTFNQCYLLSLFAISNSVNLF